MYVLFMCQYCMYVCTYYVRTCIIFLLFHVSNVSYNIFKMCIIIVVFFVFFPTGVRRPSRPRLLHWSGCHRGQDAGREDIREDRGHHRRLVLPLLRTHVLLIRTGRRLLESPQRMGKGDRERGMRKGNDEIRSIGFVLLCYNVCKYIYGCNKNINIFSPSVMRKCFQT